jgi:hypothetical protein
MYILAAVATPSRCLLFPSQGISNHHETPKPHSLFYQSNPESADFVVAENLIYGQPNNGVMGYDLESPQEDSFSVLSFLRSKSPGTGHIEYDEPTSYYTLDPTLDMLVDWTLDYVDAIDLAGGMTRISVGVEELMSDDYVFTSPTIGPCSKDDFIALMRYYQYNGLDLASAIPDLTVSYEGWHQDPLDPWRIWTIARYTGTHTGTASLPGTGLKLTPSKDPSQQIRFTTGPELQSFLWTPSKKLVWQTVGYVGDHYTGSNQGHGSLDGLLVSMGLPPLYLESTESFRTLQAWFSQFVQSEDVPKLKSPYSNLPQWWHERKTLARNIHR